MQPQEQFLEQGYSASAMKNCTLEEVCRTTKTVPWKMGTDNRCTLEKGDPCFDIYQSVGYQQCYF